MGLRDIITNGLLLRRLLAASERQAVALEGISLLLTRIADRLAPQMTEASPEELVKTGVNFSRDAEQVVIQSFVERFERMNNRQPTDDEVMEFLVERV
jgi:hypothetical protein